MRMSRGNGRGRLRALLASSSALAPCWRLYGSEVLDFGVLVVQPLLEVLNLLPSLKHLTLGHIQRLFKDTGGESAMHTGTRLKKSNPLVWVFDLPLQALVASAYADAPEILRHEADSHLVHRRLTVVPLGVAGDEA